MSQSFSSDYTQQLRSQMQRVGISHFKALSRTAGVSEWQVEQLRRGQAAQMRMEPLHKLSQALQVPLVELLETFCDLPIATVEASPSAPVAEAGVSVEQLKQEYQRLQAQLEQQQEVLQQDFQQTTLQVLESWITQFPTLVHAVQQNPQFPARNFLPFLRPIEQLLKTWNIEAIAPIGAEMPYDPSLHQLIKGTAQPGDVVEVRYTGYRQGDKLLYRAKVIPVAQ
jgi:molecular chaperone GrpE (heat shock protein)/DNA-binding Xre family transcriptional regulator